MSVFNLQTKKVICAIIFGYERGVNVDYSVRAISFDEFKPIYDERMMVDFPDNERRSVRSIRRMFRHSKYEVYVLEKENHVYGYACLIKDEGENIALLDYYAIDKAHRSEGLGSVFLQLLKQTLSYQGLLIESERPNDTEISEEIHIRERRIDFYLRNDAKMTHYYWDAFGVGYHLLWLPIDEDNDRREYVAKIPEFYRSAMPGYYVRKHTSLIENKESK